MRGVRFTNFFQGQDIAQGIHPGPTIFFRDFDSHKTHTPHLFYRFGREFSTFIELGCDRGNLFLSEISGCLANHFMLAG